MNTCAMKTCAVLEVRNALILVESLRITYRSQPWAILVRYVTCTYCAFDLIFRLIRVEQCKLRTLFLYSFLYLHLTVLNLFLSCVVIIRIIVHLNRMPYFCCAVCGHTFEVFREDIIWVSLAVKNSKTKISVLKELP